MQHAKNKIYFTNTPIKFILAISNIIFISEVIPKIWKRVRFILIVLIRIVAVLLFRWNKRLRLSSLLINDKFLFEDSYICIEWQAKNLLWIKINGKRYLSTKGVNLYSKKIISPLKIKFVGIFRTIEENIEIKYSGKLESNKFQPPAIIKSFHPEITNTPLEFIIKEIAFPQSLPVVQLKRINCSIPPFNLKS